VFRRPLPGAIAEEHCEAVMSFKPLPSVATIRDSASASWDFTNFRELFFQGGIDSIFEVSDCDFGGVGAIVHGTAINKFSFAVEDEKFRGIDGTTARRQLL
jgi:hypothetical protein